MNVILEFGSKLDKMKFSTLQQFFELWLIVFIKGLFFSTTDR